MNRSYAGPRALRHSGGLARRLFRPAWREEHGTPLMSGNCWLR